MHNPDYQWLLDCDEPWTKYRTKLDLLDLPNNDNNVRSSYTELITHPQVQGLIDEFVEWPGYSLARHNDARHPLYKLSTLADFGIRYDESRVSKGISMVMDHQSEEGPFQIMVNIPTIFGGTGVDQWSWILCDTPTILYAVLAMGLQSDPRVSKAVDYLIDLVEDNGYRCKAAPDLGNFKGPGKRSDPCPIANVYMLKGLSYLPELENTPAVQNALKSLLQHWENQGQEKLYLFGIGTDFRKLKYPFIWYDILHVTEVLSRFRSVHDDHRFLEMVNTILVNRDENNRYKAMSMYRAWKGWSFADKKNPSPWLTFLVYRIQKRIGIDIN